MAHKLFQEATPILSIIGNKFYATLPCDTICKLFCGDEVMIPAFGNDVSIHILMRIINEIHLERHKPHPPFPHQYQIQCYSFQS